MELYSSKKSLKRFHSDSESDDEDYKPEKYIRYMNICKKCGCREHPKCIWNEDSCDNCLDESGKYHLKIDKEGIGMIDILENYVKCGSCYEYCDDLNKHECISDHCKVCGDYFNDEETLEYHLKKCGNGELLEIKC